MPKPKEQKKEKLRRKAKTSAKRDFEMSVGPNYYLIKEKVANEEMLNGHAVFYQRKAEFVVN